MDTTRKPKLTQEKKRAIFLSLGKVKEVAEEFGVAESLVSNIRMGWDTSISRGEVAPRYYLLNHERMMRTFNQMKAREESRARAQERPATRIYPKGSPIGLKGIDHRTAKLNEEKVLAIYASEATVKEVAAQYGIHKNTVRCIRRGELWAWLTQQGR